MPIIYALVSYKSAVQAEATTPGLTGNFSEVAKMLVKKLPSTNSKLSYIYDAYMSATRDQQGDYGCADTIGGNRRRRFHYIIEHNWIYLCICDLKYQRMLAFQFLNELIEFVKTPARPNESPVTVAPLTPDQPSALQAFLLKQMDKYNVLVTEKHQKLYGDISSLKDTMVENIDKVLERGERIDLLVDKSDALHEQSFVFKKSARRVRDEMWWKNTKLLLGMGGGALCVLYVIISSSCGGMTWPQC